MRPRDYGAGKPRISAEVPTFLGSVVTRRWFEVNGDALLEPPFRSVTALEPDKDYHQSMCLMTGFDILLMSYYGSLDKTFGSRHNGFEASCSCGWYSYFSKPNEFDLKTNDDYTKRYYIGAVVENFGRLVYGDLGLRSEKMRVKALVLFHEKMSFKGLLRFIKAQSLLGAMVTWWLIYLVLILPMMIFDQAHKYPNVLFPITGVVLVLFWVGWYIYKSLRMRNRSVRGGRLARLKENYPTLTVYDSWEAAEKDFPHTKRSDLP